MVVSGCRHYPLTFSVLCGGTLKLLVSPFNDRSVLGHLVLSRPDDAGTFECSHEAVQERLLRLLPLVQLPAVSARFERLILVPCERWVNLPTFRRGQKAPQVLLLDNTRTLRFFTLRQSVRYGLLDLIHC
jgi:hypothetical protein